MLSPTAQHRPTPGSCLSLPAAPPLPQVWGTTSHHSHRGFPWDRRIPERVWVIVPCRSSFLTRVPPTPPQRLRGSKHPKAGQGKAPWGMTVFDMFHVSNVTITEAVQTVSSGFLGHKPRPAGSKVISPHEFILPREFLFPPTQNSRSHQVWLGL